MKVSQQELDEMVCYGGYVFTDSPNKYADVFTDGERYAVWRLDRQL